MTLEKHDFLFEIGCEELPSSMLAKLSVALGEKLANELANASLTHQEIQLFATPRRLAVLIPELISQQPGKKTERFGPNADSAYDKSGTPTMACLGFAKSCGVTADQLRVKETPKGKRVCCTIEQTGSPTTALLPNIIQQAVKKLPIPKVMRWNTHDTAFIRPVHWVVALYGETIIPMTVLGKAASNITYGHRFHHPAALTITHPKDYNTLLYSKAYVIADFETRKQLIHKEIKKVAAHDTPIINEKLLEEVTALVEWPVALKGHFTEDFLRIPREVLITSMQTHQKCFAVEDNAGKLRPFFILISNIESKAPSAVIHGNERVINARLADAAFFYDQDCKHRLDSFAERLDQVIFQKQLGSLGDKSRRITQLAGVIARAIHCDANQAKRASELAKCDLLSEMVYEFPGLQGIMGYYYALKDQEPSDVATAIKEHYWPRFSKDKLPETLTGCAVALADRLDTLVGILGINLIPTGDKDPYALRRAAHGIFRIMIEKALPLDLMDLLNQAVQQYQSALSHDQAAQLAFDFIIERLRFWYVEQGVAVEVFESVLARHPQQPLDFHQRILAVQTFQTLPEADALAAANKRVSNILKKIDGVIPEETNDALFDSDAERILAKQLTAHSQTVNNYYQQADYTKALTELATLKEPVDNFFDQVMVMTDDTQKRNNRLALLASLQKLFTQVADISLLPS